ncbi:MAG: hypothetical protein HY903_14355 [Deltaproteobacteria bacterium]|nr:hypothetical protein [Deltaproteobacteria bacterium]
MSDVAETVRATVLEIVRRQRPEVQAVVGEQALVAELGLRSMDIAELVATLEMKLNADPFEELVAISDVKTVGDLCAAYAKAVAA